MNELLSFDEAMKVLRVKESWLRMAIFRKKITFVKVGRLVRFRMIDLENYIQRNLKNESQEDH